MSYAVSDHFVISKFQQKLLVPEPLLTHYYQSKDCDTTHFQNFLKIFGKSDSLVLTGNPRQAIDNYKQALKNLSFIDNNWIKILTCNRLGFIYNLLQMSKQADLYYNESFRLISSANRIEDTLAVYETISSLLHNNLSRYKILQGMEKYIPNADSLSILRKAKYIYIKYINAYFADNDQYLHIVLDMEDALFTSSRSNYIFWQLLTRDRIANYLSRLSQITLADKYFSTVLFDVNENHNFSYLADRFALDYAKFLGSNGNIKRALEVLAPCKSHLSSLTTSQLIEYYLALVYTNYRAQNGNNYDHYLSLAEKLVKKNGVKDINEYYVVRERAQYYILFTNDTEQAIHYFLRAKKILSTYEKVEFDQRFIDYNISRCLYLTKDYSRAIDFMESSLKDFLNHANDIAYFKKQLAKPSVFFLALELSNLANAYYFWSKSHGYEIKSLERSYYLTKLTTNFRELSYYSAVSDKLNEYDLDRLIYSYSNLTNIGYEVMIRNHDSTMIEDFFGNSENSKFIMLKSHLTEEMAQKAAGVAPNIMEKMFKLRNEMDKLRIEMDTRPNDKSNFPLFPVDLYMQKEREYDSLTRFIELKYPEYLRIKRAENNISLKDVQKHLRQNQALLEYYTYSSKAFYTFYVDKDNIKFLMTPLKKDISDKIKKYYQIMSEVKFNNNSAKTIKEFINLSSSLYDLMIKPFEDLIKNKRLFIVRDESLNLIPFETLISSSFDSMNYQKGFLNLPFLNNTNPISYGYSARQLLEPMKCYKNVRFAAFVPSYGNTNNPSDVNDTTYDLLRVLKGAAREVSTMKNYYPGKIFKQKEATKNNFFAACDKYKIVHLAMHANVNFDLPMNSELIFNPDYNKSRDQLHAYEIYTHKIKSDMIVLSACNTQNGKILTGEGIMGITWGFLLAGTKNLLTTQWPVADRSGAFIMDHFYAYLSKGDPVDISLQKAKIDFLKTGDPVKSNPFYWASYVSMGNPCSYLPAHRYFFLKISVGITLLIIMVLVAIRLYLDRKNKIKIH